MFTIILLKEDGNQVDVIHMRELQLLLLILSTNKQQPETLLALTVKLRARQHLVLCGVGQEGILSATEQQCEDRSSLSAH